MPSVSLITYCKGRFPEAKQYVPAALKALLDLDELVFVDYDDPLQAGQWVKALGDPRCSVVRVEGYPWWWPNHARNLGGLAAVGEILVFSDVDFLISPELVREIRALPLRSYAVQPDDVGSIGFVALLGADFGQVNGWEEAFVGYGCDDFYFRVRLDCLGRTCTLLSNRLVPVQRSGDQVRVLEVDQGIFICYNSRLAKILPMMHPYRMNIGRNWGKGGVLLCESALRKGVKAHDGDEAARAAA